MEPNWLPILRPTATYKKKLKLNFKLVTNTKLCRLCLCTKNLSNMFRNTEQNDKFVEVLVLTTGLQIYPNDGLPQHICSECGDLVNAAYRLRRQSQNSHLELEKIFNRIKVEDTGNVKEEILNRIKIEDSNDYNEEIDIANTEAIKNDDETNEDDKNIVETTNGRSKTLKKDKIKRNGSKETKKGTTKSKKKIEKNSHKRTKKETRELYLSYVDGEFDPEGPVLGPIRCKQCSNVVVSKWSCFQSHVRKKHGLENKVVCESCGKSFFGKHSLNRHRQSYHGMERAFACRYCDIKLITKIRLEVHERRCHTGERPYKCDKCDAAYYSRKCLVQHLDSHLPTAEVQCDLCPAKLKSRAHLSRHKYEIHSGKRLVKRREQRAAARMVKVQRLDRVTDTVKLVLGQEQ